LHLVKKVEASPINNEMFLQLVFRSEENSGSEGDSWSPDGKTLAVAGLPPESAGIFLAEVETGKRTLLTRYGQDLDEFPVFSPDGQ